MSRLKAHENMLKRKCVRKRAFVSEETALIGIRNNIKGLTPYHCNVCNQWHLTSNGKQTRGTKKKRRPNPKRLNKLYL